MSQLLSNGLTQMQQAQPCRRPMLDALDGTTQEFHPIASRTQRFPVGLQRAYLRSRKSLAHATAAAVTVADETDIIATLAATIVAPPKCQPRCRLHVP